MKTNSCDCGTCRHKLCAQRVPIFSGLNEEELSHVADLIQRRQYLKGEIIQLEGSDADCLTIINQGKVKAFRYTQEGKEQILYLFSEGDFFGESNLFGGKEAAYHAEALEQTSICMIARNDFQELVRRYPEISLKIIGALCTRLERLETTIQNMGTRSVEGRISSVLLEFAERYGVTGSKGVLITLPFSREGMASYIGIARETISRKLTLLQDAGTIEMIGNKKILLLNEEALRRELE